MPGGSLRDVRRAVRADAASVEKRMTEAGQVLLALPWSGCFPAGFRCLWPDQGGPSSRHHVPTSHEITAMDEAYRWTCFIEDQGERRLVLMRSLISETASGAPRFVWSWRRLRKATGLHSDTLKARWGRGIDRIVAGLNDAAAELAADRAVLRAIRVESAQNWPHCDYISGQEAD